MCQQKLLSLSLVYQKHSLFDEAFRMPSYENKQYMGYDIISNIN